MAADGGATDRLFDADASATPLPRLRRFFVDTSNAFSRGDRAWVAFRRPETFPLDALVGTRGSFEPHRSEPHRSEPHRSEPHRAEPDGAIHRPLRHFCALAARFGFRAGTPIRLPETAHAVMPFVFVGRAIAWPASGADPDEKYAASYRHFEKLEEPEIYEDLRSAVRRLRPPAGGVIASLGVHDGREWGPFLELDGAEKWQFWGIDRATDALEAGRRRFPESQFRFVEGDIEQASTLGLPSADVLLCLNTLQSRGVDRERVVEEVVRLVAPDCRVLFSLPQCHLTEADFIAAPFDRFHAREYRAVAIKDARYLIRTLYRHGFDEVVVFGGAYLYVLGRRRARFT